ncbi:MAG: FG-GAP-like repeat-containing protein, partial [Phycisphaerae bacterium]
MRSPCTVLQHCFLWYWAVSSSFAGAQIEFIDVSASVGIGPHSMPAMGGGVSAADFDDDGDIDVFVPNGLGVADQLYRNLGNGQFVEVAASAGVASTGPSRAGLWFDYDGDHAMDL